MAGVNDGHVTAREPVLMDVLLVLGADTHRESPRCEEIEFDPMPSATRPQGTA
jgi:hypothetical protein